MARDAEGGARERERANRLDDDGGENEREREAKRRERKEKLETSYRVSQRGQPVAGMWVRLSPGI